MGQKVPFHVDIMTLHDEVTGSCILVILSSEGKIVARFIVDCGLFQEKDYLGYNAYLPFNPSNFDFCVITHNHIDHTGRIPYLVKEGFNKKIYLSEDTSRLLPLALGDTFKVFLENARRKGEKCLYNEEDIFKTQELLVPCKFEQTINVNNNVKLTLFKNGHLLGAASVLVQASFPGYEDLNILFTGDYNNKNMLFDVPELPKWVLDLPLTIVQESTYGGMQSSEMTKCFEKNILNHLNNKGTVIAPVFSLGRSQEILYELKQMQEKGLLDTNIPIYFDGKLAFKYTRMFLNDLSSSLKDDAKDFLPKNLTFVGSDNRDSLLSEDNLDTKIILTTSGMGSYGPAQLYIPKYITREDALIHFTGYVAEGTLGRKLKNAKKGETVEVFGSKLQKLADVEYTSEYSAHAKADEMISFLKKFNNLKLVLINHGEADAKYEFAEKIRQEVRPKDVEVLDREHFARVSPYGLVKTVPSKFPTSQGISSKVSGY